MEISKSNFINNVNDRFYVSRTSLILASPSIELSGLKEEKNAEGVQFREVVGSLTWITKQTRPDIVNAVRAVARLSHDPKKAHWRAACKNTRVYAG